MRFLNDARRRLVGALGLLAAVVSPICAPADIELTHDIRIGDLLLHIPIRHEIDVMGWSTPEHRSGLLKSGSQPQVILSADGILIKLGEIFPRAQYRGFLAIEATRDGLVADFFCRVRDRATELKTSPIDPANGFRILTGWLSPGGKLTTPDRTYVAPDDWKILAVPPVLTTNGAHFLDMNRRDFGPEYWMGISLTKTARLEARFYQIDLPPESWRQDLKVIENTVLSWIIYPGSANPTLIHNDPCACSLP